MNNAFKKDYKINIFDVDARHYCKFSTLVDYLWDIVISQSDTLGETNEGFVHNNCVWVLLKYDINFYEYPKFNDTISVDTFVTGYKKFYGYRGYTIRNSEGVTIGEASSIAVLIDIEKRRPVKITPDQCQVYGLKHELEHPPALDDISLLEKIDFSHNYTIGYSDIDSNNHVNNVKYMEMSVNTLPKYILNEYDLENIKVLFKKETNVGFTVHIDTEILDTVDDTISTLHCIKNEENKLLTKLKLTWKKNKVNNLF